MTDATRAGDAPERLFLFTLHKCASMLLYQVGLALTRARGLRFASPHEGGDALDAEALARTPALAEAPGCYGPIRFPLAVPRFDEARVVLHLRDPRDALVSMFYSYCYSHAGEIPGGTGYRLAVAERGIDAFVLDMATARTCPVTGSYGTGAHLWPLVGNYHQRYRRYVDEFVGRPNVTLLRYEDMVTDFDRWLAALAGVFGVSPDHPAMLHLQDEQAPKPKPAEDRWSHVRRVTPGDYREKLRPETIRRLDAVFADCLPALGYRCPH